MKTTLIIADTVMLRLKQEAAEQGRTISELVESALRAFLQEKPERRRLPPLPRYNAGRPFVDLSDRDALSRAMEGK